MKNDEFHIEMAKLQKAIAELPPELKKQLNELVEETKNRHETLCKNFNGIEATLTDLRIHIKYLVFDLEATRRENAELRKLLENNND